MLIIFTVSDQITTQNTETIIKNDRILEYFWNTNIKFLTQNVKKTIKKVQIIFTDSDQIPDQNTETIIRKDKTLEDFWNNKIQFLNQNVKTNTQRRVLQMFCDIFACTVSPQQISMLYFPWFSNL